MNKKLNSNFVCKMIRIILYKYLKIRNNVSFLKMQLRWRDNNQHNFTRIVNTIVDSSFPFDKVKVGKYTYGPLSVISSGSSTDELLEIGSFCSIEMV